MATTCLEKNFCENAWDCNITVTDLEGNPIDPLLIRNGDYVIFVLGEKRGYRFVRINKEGGGVWYSTYDLDNNPLPENHYLVRIDDCDSQYFVEYCPIKYTVTIRISGSECGSIHTTQTQTAQETSV